MFIPTIIVETSPSLEHFFHSPMLKCLKILTLGCCQTSRKKKQSCMLKCCIPVNFITLLQFVTKEIFVLGFSSNGDCFFCPLDITVEPC